MITSLRKLISNLMIKAFKGSNKTTFMFMTSGSKKKRILKREIEEIPSDSGLNTDLDCGGFH